MSSRSSSNYPEFEGRLRVGFVKSAHGIRGEIFIKLFAGTADWLDRVREFHLLAPETPAPQTIPLKYARAHKDGLIAASPAIVDRNAAEAWRGAQVYVASERLVSEPGEPIYLREILDFTLRDADGATLGRVTGFSSNGAQDLLVIARGGSLKDALVPFIEKFVREIDFDKRVVRVDLPPGLLTLGD